MSIGAKGPFRCKDREEFHEKLVDWIGDTLYDFLPEHGYEVRDEQIYTAFQIADAFADRKVHFAEAGLGTGKTFAYLLSAIPYARFMKKPVVVACASYALQEQIAGEDGDIKVLSRLLGLDVDVKMAKDPRQYVCDEKMEANVTGFHEMEEEINEWISQTKTGERSEMPMIPDHIWRKIAWDSSMSCETCDKRGYCKLMKAKEAYRFTEDLIIVDHETFFADLWSREERIANKKLPILPSYSAVIFDEGHKIMIPAAMQAGYQINKEEIDLIVASFEEVQGARESLMRAVVRMDQILEVFFVTLNQCIIKGRETTERLSLAVSKQLLLSADELRKAMDAVLFELQIEQELYFESLPVSLMQAYEIQLENAIAALRGFCKDRGKDVISWVEQKDGSFWVVPREISDRLDQYLYQQNIPVIFTSATLSNGGKFDYFTRLVGAKKPSKSSIGSPFDLKEQVAIYIDENQSQKERNFNERVDTLAKVLMKNEGHALVLTRSLSQLKKIKKQLKEYEFPFQVLYENEGDRGYLIRQFKEMESSVLIGSHFWEGIDVPGDALTMVVVFDLPFPMLDPLMEAKKKEAQASGLDPVTAIDYPEMGLKLKQGCGRLIRNEKDHGAIVILDQVYKMPWENVVLDALPYREGLYDITEF